MNPYLTVSQVVQNNAAYLNKEVQVMGIVAKGSTQIKGDGSLLFNLTDGESTIRVIYKGSPPQNFMEGEQTVAIGTLASPQVVKASQVLVKCPSKYESGVSSLIADPLFLTAMLMGSMAIVYFVVSVASKRRKQ
jgi:cytochrome c-type biogenesis protein CcmE